MKEIRRTDEFGDSIIIRFSDEMNTKVEESVMMLLINSCEKRFDVLHKIDKENMSVV